MPISGELAGHVVRRRRTWSIQALMPVAVGVEARLERGGQRGELGVELGRRVEVLAHDARRRARVRGRAISARRAGGGAAEQLELEQAVLRHRVAGAPPHVVLGVARDGRDAVAVAHDLHAGARDLHRPRAG